MRSRVQGQYLQVNTRALTDFDQMIELFGHHLSVATGAVQYRFIDDGPQAGRILLPIQDILTAEAQLDTLLDLLVGEFGVGTDHGFGIGWCLQQSRDDRGVEAEDFSGSRFQPQEQVKPWWDRAAT